MLGYLASEDKKKSGEKRWEVLYIWPFEARKTGEPRLYLFWSSVKINIKCERKTEDLN